MKFSIKDFLSKREQLLKITFTEEILNEKLHCFVLCEGSVKLIKKQPSKWYISNCIALQTFQVLDVGGICRILIIALHSYAFDYDFIVFSYQHWQPLTKIYCKLFCHSYMRSTSELYVYKGAFYVQVNLPYTERRKSTLKSKICSLTLYCLVSTKRSHLLKQTWRTCISSLYLHTYWGIFFEAGRLVEEKNQFFPSD